ncbi:MAG: HAMP domain-containing histidine kinase, partial [Eubacteriaceae bacterium]|nr:HAMP domain-containing histidine kinase [Eubacteriaceae bacterium]
LNSLSESINNLSAALERQENLRKRLTSDVAHELRTPVTTLQSHLEAFIDGVWEPDQKRLRGLHEETVRIGNMINDLEKLSRYDYEARLDLSNFDLADILQSIQEMYGIKFSESKKILKVDSEHLPFTGDKDRIKQALVNLLDNALKYTKEKDQVEIRAFLEKRNIVIEVKDTGTGIREEHLPYIFERFYRADDSRNRSTGGSGIGLSIVKSIVEAHGGTISVTSKPEEGTCFRITLPSAS